MTWGWWLLQVGTPLIVLIGIPGNILSFLVMNSRRYRSKSYSHYLCTLAVFDSLVLLSKYLHRVDSLLQLTGHGRLYSSYGDAACKIHNFTEYLCYLMSSWLVLCVTMERFIAVKFPFKKDTLCKPRSAVIAILVLFALMSYSQIFRLIVIERLDRGSGAECAAPDRYLSIYVIMHIYMYQLGLHFMLPAVIILVCNLSILCKIRSLRTELAQHGTSHNYQAHNYSKRHKTTAMLLFVSFTYIVTLLPQVLISVVVHLAYLVNADRAGEIFFGLNDARQFFELLSELNYGINFFIYVMSGAHFRYELRYLCSRPYQFLSSSRSPYAEKVYQFRKTSST